MVKLFTLKAKLNLVVRYGNFFSHLGFKVLWCQAITLARYALNVFHTFKELAN